MKINRFSKMKNGMYQIELENRKVLVHEDLILKYDLLLKKEIPDTLFITIEKENLKYQAYNLAIKELKKKLRSEKELLDILLRKNINQKQAEEVIFMLREQGNLNDNTYLEAYIHDRILLSLDGPFKIEKDLLQKGFSEDSIRNKLLIFNEELELERVQKIVQKNLRQNRKSYSEFCLKMKVLLNRLGYHNFIIECVLKDISLDEESLRKLEYDKLYRRLSSKYQGKELELKIAQKLYQKGF